MRKGLETLSARSLEFVFLCVFVVFFPVMFVNRLWLGLHVADSDGDGDDNMMGTCSRVGIVLTFVFL